MKIDPAVLQMGMADTYQDKHGKQAVAVSAIRAWIPRTSASDCAETKLFLLDRPLAPADFGATTLEALGPRSVGGDLTVHHAGTADVVGRLYGAAGWGGAYGSRMYGAYARLASWESLAALTGADGGPRNGSNGPPTSTPGCSTPPRGTFRHTRPWTSG
jgi:hypothetical protein